MKFYQILELVIQLLKKVKKLPSRSKRPLLGSDEASTVYLTTRDGDTESTDYEGLDKHKLDFTAFERKRKSTLKRIKMLQMTQANISRLISIKV